MEDLPSSSKWVTDNFVLGDVLGSGTFGKVYTVECRKKPNTLYAMKEISRCSQPKFIASEMKIMKQLGGSHNVMGLHAAYREKDRVFLVMDHFPHDPLKTLLGVMTTREKIDYMKNLLISLDYLHRNNIIHRDVKPANFLYNRESKKYALIDFGLSQNYICSPTINNSKENAPLPKSPRKRASKCLSLSSNVGEPVDNKRLKSSPSGCECYGLSTVCQHCTSRAQKVVNKAGTPGFRAPEILLKFDQHLQTPALDIWSTGVTLMGLLFRRHPVFRPADDFEAIVQIAQLISSQALVDAANKRGVSLQMPNFPGIDLVKLVRVVRPGLDSFEEGPADRCDPCARLIYRNTKGKCLCKSGEASSIEGLSEEERLCLELLTHCLQPDPVFRFTASMLINMIVDQGF